MGMHKLYREEYFRFHWRWDCIDLMDRYDLCPCLESYYGRLVVTRLPFSILVWMCEQNLVGKPLDHIILLWLLSVPELDEEDVSQNQRYFKSERAKKGMKKFGIHLDNV